MEPEHSGLTEEQGGHDSVQWSQRKTCHKTEVRLAASSTQGSREACGNVHATVSSGKEVKGRCKRSEYRIPHNVPCRCSL